MPVRVPNHFHFQAMFASLLCCTGCGASDERPVYPSTGQVLFEGKPATGAMVVLHPVDAASELAERPLGYADEKGNFSLTTYSTNDGAPPGEYGVGLVWLPAEADRGVTGEVPAATEQRNKLPARYSDPKTSGIKVQIKEGANALEPFRLTK